MEQQQTRPRDTEERAAFVELYRVSYQRVVAQVYPVLGQLAEAEEVAQDAFARALVRWPVISRYDSPEAWVRRVAFNLALSARRRARHGAALLMSMSPPESAPPVSVDHLAMVAALRTLPMSYRAALVLYHIVDLPVDEIAAELGIPVNTVKTRLRRGRVALTRVLGEAASGGAASGGGGSDGGAVDLRGVLSGAR